MKKLLFSVAIIATNFIFGQITLQHSFPNTEFVYAYSQGNDMIYLSTTQDNKLKIYKPDFTLFKSVDLQLPAGYTALLDVDTFNGPSFAISKHIFNTDDKYEFMILAYSQEYNRKLLLFNEDGQLIKDFHPNPSDKSYRWYYVFHDSSANINKILVNNYVNGYDDQTDVYSLPTSALTTKEIQSQGKLSAFPIPTNKTFNFINPKNGANKIEIFDLTGKIVINKSFGVSENTISLDVENLPKGIYIYKIGNSSSKFIKN